MNIDKQMFFAKLLDEKKIVIDDLGVYNTRTGRYIGHDEKRTGRRISFFNKEAGKTQHISITTLRRLASK